MTASPRLTGLLISDPALRQQGRSLVDRFDLELIRESPADAYYLCLDARGLQLRHSGPKAPGPILIDFAAGALAHRRRFGGGRGQPLARAAGLKPGFNPTVWDATAGLGRDGFVLASLGCQVTLCERSAILAALLQDALHRAALDADIGGWIGERLHLIHGDSRAMLQQLAEPQQAEVIYLDPMYPPGKARVLAKKDIRALQELLGPDRDSGALLEVALQHARRRVVVKRPRRAGWLGDRKPDTCIDSKRTRYDIYVTL
jgi:16S rRNA (guanine1516-N2)-methyltransferase